MSAGPLAPVGAPAAGPARRPRLRTFASGVLRQTLLDPVREGRLRDQGWPEGLRAVVLAGYVVFAAGGLLVVLSGPLRRSAALSTAGGSGLGLPTAAAWPLVVMLSFVTALLLLAAVRGPWWLAVLGTLFALVQMGVWSLRSPSSSGGWGTPLLGAAAMLAVVVLVPVRRRRRSTWWEFPLLWALVGGALAAGAVGMRHGRTFGFDFVPVTLQLTAATLGFLALPAATIAGAAVAEITVRATVAATRGAQQLTRARAAFAVLGVLVGLRLLQLGHQLAGRDPVSQGWNLLLPALLVVAGTGVAGGLLLATARRRGAVPVVGDLGDELGAIGFPVAVALIAVNLPVQLLAAAVPVLAALGPGGVEDQTWVNDLPLLVEVLVDPVRALVGVGLLVLAVRAARAGRAGRALVLGSVGVVLVALARSLVLGDRVAGTTDPDALNLVATVVVLAAVVVTSVRRRLTPVRALGFAGVLTLSALVAHRTLLADPLGVLLGFSGAALLLVGLTWDLLTGAGWGNGSSARFPRPTRVLLVLTNSLLTMTVLAYAALVRDGSTTVYLDPYAELGDLVLGTGLLGAAVVAVLDAAWRGRPAV
ncbi:hypothetical protein GCM10009714_36600 [Microlunatus capsulatus]